MMKIAVPVILIVLWIPVTDVVGQTTQQNRYNIEINYEDLTNRRAFQWANNLISNDSLYIFFESNFYNNFLELYINGELVVSDTLTTIDNLDLANHYIFNIQNIKNYGLRINGGPLVHVDITSTSNNKWAVNYFDNRIRVTILANAPIYD